MPRPGQPEERGRGASRRDRSRDRRASGGERASDGSERALVEAWRHGDSDAIATLLRGYQSRIYAVCYRMLRSQEEAADLTQESLLRILEGLHTYDGRSQLSTWIIRVAMNCCLSHLRRQRLRRHASLDEPSRRGGSAGSGSFKAVVGPLSPEPSGPQRVEQAELRSALLRGLRRLDAEARAILVLRDLHALEYQQIGEVLGVPVGTVKSRLFRARLALRESTLAEQGGGEGLAEGSPGALAKGEPRQDGPERGGQAPEGPASGRREKDDLERPAPTGAVRETRTRKP